MPKLIVSSLDALNGEYPFDWERMNTISDADSFTFLEARKIKQLSAGILLPDLDKALIAGDPDAYLALAIVILERAGKTVDVDRVLASGIGAALAFDFTDVVVEEADADVPPPVPPPSNEPIEEQPTSGGGSSSQTSELYPVSGRSLTGPPLSVTPSVALVSDLETLAV